MKKAVQAVPNQRLKEARELRGWSQRHVAEQLGADHYYLSRWERGTAFPSPYYRSKLCALFGMDAKALGLLPEAPGKSPENAHVAEEHTIAPAPRQAIAPPAASITDPAIPPLLVAPGDVIGREQLQGQLRAYLCSGKAGSTAALYGLPGVGKTTLAVALTADPALQEQFGDGILWAGLGPHPDIVSLLRRWGTLLGLGEGEQQKLQGQEAWIRRIRATIGTQRMLLVIDDAWELEQALAFKVGGPACAYLLTTRFPGLALQFAGSGATQVKELSDQEGVRLLARLAPQVVTDEPKSALSLVQSVGGLPLALTLIGNFLRLQAHSGQPRRLRAAIERLRSGEERLHLAETHALLERPPGLPEGAPISLEMVIDLSAQQLDQQAREALYALAIFPPKPNSFSEEAAVAVSQAPVETLDALSDAGLLETSGPERYTLHQTIADYARARPGERRGSAPLIAYFTAFVEQHARGFDQLNQEMPSILVALEAASTAGDHEHLTRLVNALFDFFFTRGRYAQEAGEYIERAVQSARLLKDEALLAAALLHQGKAAYKQGQYNKAQESLQEGLERAEPLGEPKLCSELLMMLGILARWRISHDVAEQHLQASLALARQANDPTLLSQVLSHLGNVLSDKGRSADAEAYTEEALALAQSVGDRPAMTQLLVNRSSLAITRGDLAGGEAYGQEALALARDIGFLDAQCAVLTNLGSAAMDQEEYEKAEAYFSEALDVARRIDDVKILSADLGSLGVLASRQGRDEQAAAYLQEALQIARQIGDIWLLGAVLLEWGELTLKQQRLDEAFAAFEEALTTSAKGNQEVVATARYGLARVAAGRGDTAEAQRQGQESLALFEAMGHRMTETVRVWLETMAE